MLTWFFFSSYSISYLKKKKSQGVKYLTLEGIMLHFRFTFNLDSQIFVFILLKLQAKKNNRVS